MLRSLTEPTPVVNSKPVRSRAYSVELQRSGPAMLPAVYHNLHIVAVVLSGKPVVVREGFAGRHSARFERGESSVYAAGPGQGVTWPAGMHCLYVHLHPRLIRRIGEEIMGVPGLALQTRPWLRDPVLSDIGFQLHQLIASDARVDLRVAHDLVMALAHHVTVSYAGEALPALRVGTRSVEEILDVFRDNVPSWDGVAALASQCGLTRSHFTRRVRALTGVSPYAMVLGSRIEAAKHLLERHEGSLSEVAYATGFVDQSHLTRVFRGLTGMTPARYIAMRSSPRR